MPGSGGFNARRAWQGIGWFSAWLVPLLLLGAPFGAFRVLAPLLLSPWMFLIYPDQWLILSEYGFARSGLGIGALLLAVGPWILAAIAYGHWVSERVSRSWHKWIAPLAVFASWVAFLVFSMWVGALFSLFGA